MRKHFLIKQRAVMKLYLISMVERHKRYGLQYLNELKSQFAPLNFKPTHSELYKALHELTNEGILVRHKQKRTDDPEGFQEVVTYTFAEDGYEKAKAYKKQVRDDLERSEKIISKILRDNY